MENMTDEQITDRYFGAIARELCGRAEVCRDTCNRKCAAYKYAVRLYAKGYRKQRVDAVEVVRCKDCTKCESFYPCKEIGKEAYPLVYYCKFYGNNTLPNNYCNYGKRKVSE